MPDAHKNFAYSTVATAPSPASSGTSLVVAAGAGADFPAVPFNATIWPTAAQPTVANAEVVRVTGRSTDTLTITRAQEGTAARTVIVGDQVMLGGTAKAFTDLAALRTSLWGPTGAITETFSRVGRDGAKALLQTGRLHLSGGCIIPAYQAITNVSFMSGGTGAGTPTNWWFCLVDQALNVLATTADQTSTAWATETLKTVALTSPYTPTVVKPVYAGIMVKATTVPTLYGSDTGASGSGAANLSPPISGLSTSSLTTPASLGATAGALSTSELAYAYLT